MNDPAYINRPREFDYKKYPHKYTTKEYIELRSSLKQRLKFITDMITSYIQSVKKIILQNDINNIIKAIDYFFNDKTYKLMDYHLNLFVDGTKRIKQLFIELPPSDNQFDIDYFVNGLIAIEDEFKDQYTYIQQLENQVYNAKKEFYRPNLYE